MTSADLPGDSLSQLQHTIQRKLGRCMLILQQYEQQLKRLIGASSFIISVDADGQSASLSSVPVGPKTLGQLTGQFITTVLVASSVSWDGEDDRRADTLFREGRDVLVLRHGISMEPSRREATRQDFARIVALRNELVHHFIEKFDLWSVEGCEAAEAYLAWISTDHI